MNSPNTLASVLILGAWVVSVGTTCRTTAADAASVPPLPAEAVAGLADIGPSQVVLDARDYGFMWWPYGWRGEKVRCYQTGHYGLAMDAVAARTVRFGVLDRSASYLDAAVQPNAVVLSLPSAALDLRVDVGETSYTCGGGEGASRLIASGRFLQRSDIQGLRFHDVQGRELAASGRLEIVAWPDRLSAILEIVPKEDLQQARLELRFTAAGREVRAEIAPANWTAFRPRSVHAVLWSFGTPFARAGRPSRDSRQHFGIASPGPVRRRVRLASG